MAGDALGQGVNAGRVRVASAGAVHRCLRLALLLSRHPQGLVVAALLERQGCSRAQLYRDLGALSAAGWSVGQAAQPGEEAVYRMNAAAAVPSVASKMPVVSRGRPPTIAARVVAELATHALTHHELASALGANRRGVYVALKALDAAGVVARTTALRWHLTADLATAQEAAAKIKAGASRIKRAEVLAFFSSGEPVALSQIRKALSAEDMADTDRVGLIVRELVKAKSLVAVGHGIYQSTGVAPPRTRTKDLSLPAERHEDGPTKTILLALASGPRSTADLAVATGYAWTTTLLGQLAKRGLVRRVSRGVYALP